MDPLHTIAASQVPHARKSEAEQIEAFYDAHAFEGFHEARRIVKRLLQFLRNARSRNHRDMQTGSEIASAAGRA